MINGIVASLSGLKANEKKLANTAGNIANFTTDGYKKTEATITEDAAGLPDVTLTRVTTPGAIIVAADGVPRETSNVDLSREMTDMLIATRAYQANIKALKAQDETVESLLDIFA